MNWKTEDLKARVRQFLSDNLNAGRYSVMEQFDLTEFKARELVREIRGEPDIPTFGPRIAYFDIETTDLKGDIGSILVASVLSYPEMEMTTLRIDSYGHRRHNLDDSSLARDLRDLLEQHHIICGWYSKGFDIPFLNTRLVAAGHRKLENHLHFDPYFQHKGWHGVKLCSASLANVAEFYGLDVRKMHVDKSVWKKAMAGDTGSLDILVDRCESDVLITAEVIQKVFDARLVKNITRFA